MYTARIYITLRPSILDPQGKAVAHAMENLGIPGVREVRMGKLVDVTVDAPSETEARQVVDDMCRKLLANPVMENYEFVLTKAG